MWRQQKAKEGEGITTREGKKANRNRVAGVKQARQGSEGGGQACSPSEDHQDQARAACLTQGPIFQETTARDERLQYLAETTLEAAAADAVVVVVVVVTAATYRR
ncbi:hypothetical protein O3P69_002388 [Scylla paramamosain]|uniref:Uncharacterized protein n=1 Tax=Scylla paramamosain TaxID=85552 RepID=A0AAW0V7X7_SCYPA